MADSPIHTERTFETAIEDSLLTVGGYTKGDPAGFDPQRALWPSVLVSFLKDSQPDAWRKLAKLHGTAIDSKIIALVAKELDQRGTLDCTASRYHRQWGEAAPRGTSNRHPA